MRQGLLPTKDEENWKLFNFEKASHISSTLSNYLPPIVTFIWSTLQFSISYQEKFGSIFISFFFFQNETLLQVATILH